MNNTTAPGPARWPLILPALGLINIGLIVGAIGARHLFDVQALAAFRFLYYGAKAGLWLAAAGVVVLVVGLVIRKAPVWKNGIAAAVLGVLPLATAVAIVGPSGFKAPPIHDISTDLENPPAFVASRALRGPNENSLDYGGAEVAAAQRSAYPDIGPIHSGLAPDAAFAKTLNVVNSMGWELTDSDPAAGRIEAAATSLLYQFVDDVAIRITPEGSGSRIDIRSVSRVGRSDVGANAARIRRFVRAFH